MAVKSKLEYLSGNSVVSDPVAPDTQAESSGTRLITLQRLSDDRVPIPIVGLSPYIPHRWSEKSKRMMLEAQQREGKTGVKAAREPKDPNADRLASLYTLPDGRPGIPAVAFKSAMVEACRFFEGISMTEAKRMLFVEGEGPEQLVPLEGERHEREDTPRNATGVADLRYRFSFYPWGCLVIVRFPKNVISDKSVLALLDAGGRNGVGDWRPGSPKSNTGTFGTFRVRDEEFG